MKLISIKVILGRFSTADQINHHDISRNYYNIVFRRGDAATYLQDVVVTEEIDQQSEAATKSFEEGS